MTEAGVIVEVEVDPATAFEVFTAEAQQWWNRDRSLFGATGTVTFEPGSGGRLMLDGTHEVGRISTWEPGPRLAFSYGPPGSPDRTDVEVRFEATEFGTRVVLRHGGWTEDDPAGGPWATILAGFARHSLERRLLHRLGQFLDAIAEGDTEFFERYLTDDALLIFPGPKGIWTKRECVAEMGDHPNYLKYDIADQRVVQVSQDTAVLTHRATVLQPEWPQPRTLTVGSVMTKVDGKWRLALHQWTPAE